MKLLALLLLAACGLGCHHLETPHRPAGASVKVVSYNINWGGARPDLALEYIRQADADIVCLQETTPDWEHWLRSAFGKTYPHINFRSSAGRMGGGLAFLSKMPARDVSYMPSATGWFDGWIRSFETPVGDLQILNVHLRPPVSDSGGWISGYFTTGDYRLREVQRFFGERSGDMPILVAGDFNDSPSSSAVKWLTRQGLTNALPQFDRKSPTWEWPVGPIKLHRRMDHILYSREFHCCSARVTRAGASDHFPLEAVFERQPSQ